VYLWRAPHCRHSPSRLISGSKSTGRVSFLSGSLVLMYNALVAQGLAPFAFLPLIGPIIFRSGLIFLGIFLLQLAAAVGASERSIGSYQRLGMNISAFGVFANVFMFGLALSPWGAAIFITGALVQFLALFGYRIARRTPIVGLLYVWLGVWGLIVSGLLSFFPSSGIMFGLLLLGALVAAIGASATVPILEKRRVVFIGGGLVVALVLFYTMLGIFFGA
jgi:hypothetical protein